MTRPTCSFDSNPAIVRVSPDSAIDRLAKLCWFHNAISLAKPEHRIVIFEHADVSRTTSREMDGAA